MRHFIVTVFCSFLTSGNLQTINNAPYYQMPPADTVLVPVVEETIWPVHAYQTFQGNFYGTARRSLNAKPCIRQGNQDVSFEQANQIARHGNNGQEMPQVLPNAYQLEKQISNTQEVAPQPPVSNQVQRQYSETLMTLHQPVNNQLINQVEEPSPTRRSSISDTEKNPETNLDSTDLRTQVIIEEEQDSLRSSNSGEISESLRTSNNFENQESTGISESPENPGNNENTETTSEEETTFVTRKSSEESTSEENLSEEKKNEIAPETFRIEQQFKYNFEASTDLIVNPPTPPAPVALREISYSIDTSNIQCSGKNPTNMQLPEAPRRFLIGSNNPPIYQKSIITKTVGRSGTSELSIDPNINSAVNPGINPGTNLAVNSRINPNINPGNQILVNSPAKTFGNNLPSNPINKQADPYYSYSNSIVRPNSNPEYQENQQRNPNQDTSISKSVNVLKAANNLSEKSSSYPKPVGRSGNLQYHMGNDQNTMYSDPTQGQGISFLKKTTLMLMDYDRICYACSTANNPTCATPDRKTSVKYCRKGDNACVTKTFGSGSSLTLIRDCGRSCTETDIPVLVPKFKTCKICYSDLCNSGYSINIHSLILTIPTIVLLGLVKPTV